MSTYESDPAGLGVGKRYGPLAVGGLTSAYRGEGTSHQVVFELAGGEVLTGVPMQAEVLEGYTIDSVVLEVSTAFASTSSADIVITPTGGSAGNGLTTDFDLATLSPPVTDSTMTGLTEVSNLTGATIQLTGDAAAIASTVGEARVVVNYTST